ncbi:MAG: ChbG/HpnK family deacetylase [Bacillota bacterium]|nr:ChbG/HpnK family deacetylase [Bacillota bacterium]
MKKIIVRADDLGFSEGVNYGIEKACRDGIIRSVGIMPNMPATEHGWNLVKDLPLCFGQHTNICVGKPLTDPKLIPSICDENGNLKSSKVYRQAMKNGIDIVNLDEVVIEIEAQYQAFKKITGREPSYFEGHAVASPNFNEGLRIVAERHGLNLLPVCFDGPTMFKNTKMISPFDFCLPGYNPIEVLKREAIKERKEDECLMMVCHPGYLDQYILDVSSLTLPRPLEVQMAISQEVKDFLKENDIEVITYDDI